MRKVSLYKLILGSESSLRLLAAAKRLVLRAGKTPDLILGCSPGGVNTWFTPFPYYIVFLL